MELHLIRTKHLGSQLGDNLAIDGDYTCLDELISLTTTADACISEELVQTNRLIGIEVLLLVLNALLHAVFRIRIVVGRTGTETSGTLGLSITALLLPVRFISTLLTRLIAPTLLARLITTLLARLVATARLITTLLTRLVTTLLAGLITTLTTVIIIRLIGFIRLLIIVTGLIAALLTRLVTTAIVVTGTIALTLGRTAL